MKQVILGTVIGIYKPAAVTLTLLLMLLLYSTSRIPPCLLILESSNLLSGNLVRDGSLHSWSRFSHALDGIDFDVRGLQAMSEEPMDCKGLFIRILAG